MIQDGIDYGEGYEKATEPGPDVERLHKVLKKWVKREDPLFQLVGGESYRRPIKPKDNTMSDKNSVGVPDITITIEGIRLTFDQIEKAYAEAQRIKAENEIKVGDFIFVKSPSLILLVHEINERCYRSKEGLRGTIDGSTKITNPAHIQALREIYEGMK